MRWPIRIQLLLPMLTVVVAAIALVSIFGAFSSADRARRMRQENLHRVIATLAEANFPLTEPILRQMSGLSGAEFVFFDKGYRLQASTIPLSVSEGKYLQQKSFENAADGQRQPPSIVLRNRTYSTQRITVKDRPPFTPGGWLAVLYPEENWAANLWRAAYPALLVGATAILALMILTMILAHRFTEPIRRLGDRAAVIAGGNFEPAPVARRNDEIRDLTISINQMAQRLGQYESDVRRHEQLRILGQLGAGLAHQLRNAATGGRMAIELHQMQCPEKDEHGRETLEVALRQLRLMESYLQRFLTLGQTCHVSHEPVALDFLVEDALELIRPRAVHAGVEIIYNKKTMEEGAGVRAVSGLNNKKDFTITGDADALRQLFVNLLINALEAIGEIGGKGRIEIEVGRADDKVVVKISDSGPGPDAKVAERLFEPFVTAKPEGTGLGLYVARQTVESHGGKIRWLRQNEMTCFEVEFNPCSQAPPGNTL
jgi:signal transduction histidine kinase